jgi:RNA polymerase sigma-70 factor, ECF subfamily
MELSEEAELVGRAVRGDRAAFEALVRAHRGAVYRFALRMTRDEAAAEDVLQETFLSALRHLEGWRGEGGVRPWLLAIAHRQLLRRVRRRAAEPAQHEALDSLEVLGLEAGWGSPLEAEALRERLERRAVLEAALARLDEPERAVLWWRDVEGLSGEATAQLAGLTVPAMKSRLHRARLRLVALVKKEAVHGDQPRGG